MKYIQKRTCIKFRPKRPKDRAFVNITNLKTACHSKLGFMGNAQQLNLQVPMKTHKDGCLARNGTAVHEIMHALGFYHEQSRLDRDRYITVVEKNILNKKIKQFRKRPYQHTLRTPYDLCSIMHYRLHAFSKVN